VHFALSLFNFNGAQRALNKHDISCTQSCNINPDQGDGIIISQVDAQVVS